jgi:hypothetical protein
MAWAALTLMACLVCLPATSGAFPIRWWEPSNPTVGDPDQPGGGRLVRARTESPVGAIGQTSLISIRASFYFFLYRFLNSSR